MAKDYYAILGIQKTASQEEVKKAFHVLAHKHHPNKGGDEKKFKEINEAYQVLSNQDKRAQYDQFGQVFDNGMPGGAQGQGFDPNWFWSQNRGDQGGVEFDLGDLGDVFGDFFGFGQRNQKRPKDVRKGTDLKIEIEVDLEDTLEETKKTFSLRKLITCVRCQGTGAEPGTRVNECVSCRGSGQVHQIRKTILGSFTQTGICPECQGEGQRPEKPCNVCKGEGRIKGEEDIEVLIPAGIDTNQVIKIMSRGNSGRRSGKAGDLYVRVIVKPHPIFERKGDDLYSLQQISFIDAALGGEVEIPALEKTKIVLNVPAGTESGKTFRISGKGIQHFSRNGRGDLYVQLSIKIPKKLSRSQKDLLEKLKQEGL